MKSLVLYFLITFFIFLLLQALFSTNEIVKIIYIILYSISVILGVYIISINLLNSYLDKILLYIFMLLIFAFTSSFVNNVPMTITFSVMMYSMKFLFVYFIAKSLNKKNLYYIEKAILYILLILLFVGVLEIMIPNFNNYMVDLTLSNNYDFYIQRMKEIGVTGTLGSKNMFGLFMNIGFAIAYGLKMKVDNKRYVIMMILFAIGILISASKINILLLITFVTYIISKRISIAIIVFIIVMFLPIIYFLLLQSGKIDKGVFALFDKDYWDIASTYGRIALWITSLDIITNNPLFGIGAGKWGTGLAYLKDDTSYSVYYKGYSIPRGVLQDNFWLSEISQFGILYFSIFVMLLYNLYRSLVHKLFVNYIFIIIIVSSFVYPTITMKPIGYLFWLLAGLYGQRKKVMRT